MSPTCYTYCSVSNVGTYLIHLLTMYFTNPEKVMNKTRNVDDKKKYSIICIFLISQKKALQVKSHHTKTLPTYDSYFTGLQKQREKNNKNQLKIIDY